MEKKTKNKISKNTKKAVGKTKKVAKKTKSAAQKTKEKVDKARQTSTWQKTKRVAKKVARITGSHLATLRASITLSNEESELLSKLENRLKKKKRFASKSEILRAGGLWRLSKISDRELEAAVKDLLEVKQIKFL